MMERRYLENSVSEVRMAGEGESRQIVGYASVFYDGTPGTEFNLTERIKERVLPNAFRSDVDNNEDVVALFNHDPNLVLGRTSSGTLRLSNDAKGLRYEVDPPASRADVVESIQRRDVKGSSFAFKVVDEEWTREGEFEIRTLRALKLLDVSPVTNPAYKSSTAGVRGEGDLSEIMASRAAWLAKQEAERRNVSGKKAVRVRMLELEQESA